MLVQQTTFPIFLPVMGVINVSVKFEGFDFKGNGFDIKIVINTKSNLDNDDSTSKEIVSKFVFNLLEKAIYNKEFDAEEVMQISDYHHLTVMMGKISQIHKQLDEALKNTIS